MIQAWYPLGHGDVALLQQPVFVELGEKYGKSPAQIILRWHIQDGNIVIPGSKNPDHIRDKFDLFDFSLTDEEMQKITDWAESLELTEAESNQEAGNQTVADAQVDPASGQTFLWPRISSESTENGERLSL